MSAKNKITRAGAIAERLLRYVKRMEPEAPAGHYVMAHRCHKDRVVLEAAQALLNHAQPRIRTSIYAHPTAPLTWILVAYTVPERPKP